jgi:hypothetical protein
MEARRLDRGETLLIERRYAGWRMERMPDLVDELLRRHHAELLIALGTKPPRRPVRARRPCRSYSTTPTCRSNVADRVVLAAGAQRHGCALLSAWTPLSRGSISCEPRRLRLAAWRHSPDTGLFTVSGTPLDSGPKWLSGEVAGLRVHGAHRATDRRRRARSRRGGDGSR